jgi:hypothetical protein
MMRGIRRHYDRVAEELVPEPGGMILPSRIHAVVLVSRLHRPTIRALAYARATRPDTLTAVTVAITPDEVRQLQSEWDDHGIPVPLRILDSPYRDITGSVLAYVAEEHREHPRDLIVVYIPEYVVGRWWEHLLHNQSALRIKGRLLFEPGVMVTSVPYQLASTSTKDLDRLDRFLSREVPRGPRARSIATPEIKTPDAKGRGGSRATRPKAGRRS